MKTKNPNKPKPAPDTYRMEGHSNGKWQTVTEGSETDCNKLYDLHPFNGHYRILRCWTDAKGHRRFSVIRDSEDEANKSAQRIPDDRPLVREPDGDILLRPTRR